MLSQVTANNSGDVILRCSVY